MAHRRPQHRALHAGLPVSVLVTHAGKIGDALWAMSTMKALSEYLSEPLSFVTSTYCHQLPKLVESQLWCKAAWVEPSWQVQFTSPVTPIEPELQLRHYMKQMHLSMRRWPEPTIIEAYPKLLESEYGIRVAPDFNSPWLYLGNFTRDEIVLSFSDENVECKVGYVLALLKAFPKQRFRLCTMTGSRLSKEFEFPALPNFEVREHDLFGLAQRISDAKLVICCNSSTHPLAAALGKRTIVVEPTPARWQSCFKAPISKVSYLDSVNANELVALVERSL